eukprot:XP_001694055.1 predicted protein [Chlamydomonas reinhardtii]
MGAGAAARAAAGRRGCALHWVAQPYVHELRYTAASGQVEVRTTTLLGNSRWSVFSVDDVQPLPWNRPVATFMVCQGALLLHRRLLLPG